MKARRNESVDDSSRVFLRVELDIGMIIVVPLCGWRCFHSSPLYSFPIAAVTNDHKLSDLEFHTNLL